MLMSDVLIYAVIASSISLGSITVWITLSSSLGLRQLVTEIPMSLFITLLYLCIDIGPRSRVL